MMDDESLLQQDGYLFQCPDAAGPRPGRMKNQCPSARDSRRGLGADEWLETGPLSCGVVTRSQMCLLWLSAAVVEFLDS